VARPETYPAVRPLSEPASYVRHTPATRPGSAPAGVSYGG